MIDALSAFSSFYKLVENHSNFSPASFFHKQKKYNTQFFQESCFPVS